MFGVVARCVAGRGTKWLVVAVWIALLVVFYPNASKLEDVTTDDDTGALPEETQSRQVADLLAKRFPPADPPRSTALVVYHRDGGLTEEDRARTLADAEKLAQVKGIGEAPFAGFAPMAPPGLVSEAGDTAMTSIGFPTDQPAELEGPVEDIREIVGIGTSDGLEVHVTGDAALEVDFEAEFARGESRLLYVTATLVLLLLTAIYRSPIIALVPLVTVGIGYVVATGIVYSLADDGGLMVTDVATALLLVLMFGAGTDYCLLLVARYAEDLRRTKDHHEALRNALPRAGPAMTASGVTVALALLALLVADLGSTRNLGPVNAIGIGCVLVAGLTLLPALLAIVGRRGFWPSERLIANREQREQAKLLPGLAPLPGEIGRQDLNPSVRERDGIWGQVGQRVLRRPRAALATVTVALIVGAAGLFTYESSGDFLAQFRSDVDSTRGFDVLSESFPAGALAPMTVLVQSRDEPVDETDLATVMEQIDPIKGVAGIAGAPDESRDGRIVSLSYTLDEDPYDNAALDLVPVMRNATADIGGGLTVLIGETTAAQFDTRETAQRDLEVVVPAILAVVLLVLALLLRAIAAPLYLMGTVIVSFFGTLGISLLIFKVILGETGYDPQLPTFAFMFLVALGVDYNIFLMDRVRDEARTHGTRDGLLRALVATGPVITSAGLILAGTFATLLSLPITILVEMGIAVALGVLVDTFVVRTVMVPAIIQLVGDASWWPSRLSRRGGDDEPPGPPQGGVLGQAATEHEQRRGG